jgi:hypothetical protein
VNNRTKGIFNGCLELRFNSLGLYNGDNVHA